MQVWEYFKERKGFNRLFLGLKEKYLSLGRYSGSVILKNVTRDEANDLSDFFGVIVNEGVDFKTSFSKIEKVLRISKFSDFTWEDLFLGYFSEELVDKKNVVLIEKKKEEEFFKCISNNLKEPYKSFLSNVVLEKGNLYQVMLKRYHKNKYKFKSDLENIFKILSSIDSYVPTSLTIISSISGNPHFLDFWSSNSSLFIKLMAKFYGCEEPVNTLEKIDFLSKFKIYVDNYSNFVITFLLESDMDFINDFKKANEVLNLNLSNLSHIGKLDTSSKKVYVFENPSMLSVVKNLGVPVIISSGNPNYVVYKVLEKLISSGNEIYYNGDFDPEGLCIASNLKKSFPTIKFFCYDKLDYEVSVSNNKISSARLRKLDKVKDSELIVMKNLLLENNVSGYQERNIKRVVEFVSNNL